VSGRIFARRRRRLPDLVRSAWEPLGCRPAWVALGEQPAVGWPDRRGL